MKSLAYCKYLFTFNLKTNKISYSGDLYVRTIT